jgi:hypothetical protein
MEGDNLDEYDFSLNEAKLKLKQEKENNSVFFRIKSSLFVLNYSLDGVTTSPAASTATIWPVFASHLP